MSGRSGEAATNAGAQGSSSISASVSIPIARVRCGRAASSAWATQVSSMSDSSGTATTSMSNAVTHSNHLLLTAPLMRRLGVQPSQRCIITDALQKWRTVVHVWQADTKTKQECRLLLCAHATSPLTDGCTILCSAIIGMARAARMMRVKVKLMEEEGKQQQQNEHRTLYRRMRQAMSNIIADVMVGQVVMVGMHVSAFVFDEICNVQICDIDDEQQQPSEQNQPRQFYIVSHSTRVSVVEEVENRDGSSSSHDTADSPQPEATDAITCQDIGGLEQEIESLHSLINLPLLQPHLFTSFGIKPPKGVLLYGPPGTGKTMLARAVAQQASASFYLINGPEIISKFVGESEEKLVSLFATARRHAPSIIFLDEIDSLCPKRDETTDELQKRIVASLLTLMDGLSSSSGYGTNGTSSASSDRVLVIAATNRPDSLDPALRRAGRLDRELEIGIPNEIKRLDILKRILTRMPHNITQQELSVIASVTHGYVGADLKALCREAALAALERWQQQQLGQQSSVVDSTESSLPTPTSPFSSLNLLPVDFSSALKRVEPSAMRSVVVDVPKISWSDIGGQAEIKQKLKEAVEWPLNHPEAFLRLGIQPPKGILLYGPPGCSKTLLAKALANESSRNFLAVKGPELFSKWVGESEKGVKEVFRKARAAAPAIVFFDEIDSIAASRGEGGEDGGGERVAHRVLSQSATQENMCKTTTRLLTELDGIEPLKQVTVLAATNRPDLIDKALLRPGRIDRILYVAPPDEEACLAILRIELSRIGAAAADIDASQLAPRCVGMSGAEIAALCREAAIVAMEEDTQARKLTMDHFHHALTRVPRRITSAMLRFYHEYRARSSVAAI